jgi:hypothetical protein
MEMSCVPISLNCGDRSSAEACKDWLKSTSDRNELRPHFLGRSMTTSRRSVLKLGVALSAVPLVGGFDARPEGKRFFSSGLADLDRALGGGIRPGSFVAVVGPPGSGKSAFLLRLAKANGIVDPHPMNTGGSDMLSIMERENNTHIGSLMLNSAEPATDAEELAMKLEPNARDRFLARWFARTKQIVDESGGLFVISAWGTTADSTSAWTAHPDYIIGAADSGYRILKSPARNF